MLVGIANVLLYTQHAASFTVQQPILASSSVHHVTTTADRASGGALVMLRSRGDPRRRGGSSRNRRDISRGVAAVTTLRISEEDRERDLKFERELDRDAQRWINGDAKKQELWNKAKSWRNLNKCKSLPTYTNAWVGDRWPGAVAWYACVMFFVEGKQELSLFLHCGRWSEVRKTHAGSASSSTSGHAPIDM